MNARAGRWVPRGAVLIAAVPVIVLATRALSKLDGFTRGYDEGVYWASLRSLSHGHALVGEVFTSQGPLFLPFAWAFFSAFGHTLVAARLVSIVGAVIALGSIWWIGRQLAGAAAGLVAVGVAACQTVMLQVSSTLAAEAPCLGLSTLGVALSVRARERDGSGGLVWAAAAGVSSGCAVLIKVFAVVTVPAAMLFLLSGREVDGERRLTPIVVYVASLVATVMVGFAAVWHGGAVVDQTILFHLRARGVGHGLSYNVRLLLSARGLAPLELLAGAGVIVLARRHSRHLAPVAVWTLASFLFLLAVQPLWSHHRILLVPPLALLVGLAVAEARQAVLALLGAAAVVVFIGVLMEISAPAPRRGPSPEVALVIRTIKTTTRPTDLVISDDQYIVSSAARDVPPQLVDTSMVRLRSGDLSDGALRRATTVQVGEVVFQGGGRFDRYDPRYRRWVAARFYVVLRCRDGTTIYHRSGSARVRRRCPSGG